MGATWKDDLAGVREDLNATQKFMDSLYRQQVAMSTKLDLMHRLIQDQVAKMADRLIEMAMISQGGVGRKDANLHRQVANQDDQTPENDNIWGEHKDDWPPPGTVSMELP